MNTLKPMTTEEVLALFEDQNLDDFRKEAALHEELWAEAETYIDLPPQNWPPLIFNWDFKAESQHLALDGVKPTDFKLYYPYGFRLGWVQFIEFDNKLCHFSRRDGNDELWNLGFKSSLARVIVHLSRGLPITPPLVGINSVGELCIFGGHHRYAAVKATQYAELLPIYFEPLDYDSINNLVTLKCDAP